MRQIKHWQDPISGLLGVWLVVSPWVLGFADATTPTANAALVGLALLAAALGATFVPRAWEEWTEVALGAWLVVLKGATGHWLGNSEFAEYNLRYPLNPLRFGFAMARRIYYLLIGSGHFIGTLAVIWAWRRMPSLRNRSWRITTAVATAHLLTVTALGGAVLERYLVPVIPLLYIAFAISLRALSPRARAIALMGLLVCLAVANFVNPPYPFPFENNLAFVHFVGLEEKAASAVEQMPGVVATAFPMADALRRPEFGFITQRRRLIELKDFKAESIAGLENPRPDVMVVFNTEWDPLHLLGNRFVRSMMRTYYGYEPSLTPQEIAQKLSLRVVRSWESGGLTMSVLAGDP